MTQPQSAALVAEAERYLALIDLFRAEGCEPYWRSEAKDSAHVFVREARYRDLERSEP